jgi:hypothetical protein
MLIGENGVGKSSVLRAIALAFMTDSQRRRLAGPSNRWLTRGARHGSIRLSFTTGDRVELRYSLDRTHAELVGSVPKTCVLAYGSTRLLPRRGMNPPRPTRTRVENLFNPMSSLRDAESWMVHQRAVSDDAFDLLAASLKSVLSLGEESVIVRNASGLSARAFEEIAPIRDLSDGYQSMLALVMDMMLHLSQASFDMAGVEGLVLLDELEVHLHPRWKISIVRALRELFPRVRFITTTHDPLCVQGLDSGELHVMTREPETHNVSGQQIDVPPGTRADQILTGAWFGLPSTRDPETIALMEEHGRLILTNDKTEPQRARQTEIEQLLRARLTEFGGTALEQLGLHAAAEIKRESPQVVDREQLQRKILDRLRQKISDASV